MIPFDFTGAGTSPCGAMGLGSSVGTGAGLIWSFTQGEVIGDLGGTDSTVAAGILLWLGLGASFGTGERTAGIDGDWWAGTGGGC